MEDEKLTPIQNYNLFWKSIVERNGKLNKSQIIKELSDYSFLMRETSKLYCELTGNRLSKTTYYASTILGEMQAIEQDRYDEFIEKIKTYLSEHVGKVLEQDNISELLGDLF